MRRWLPLTVAAILLAALVIVFTQLRPQVSYDFLSGHAPAAKGQPWPSAHAGHPDKVTAVYSFKADYHRVKAAADAELPGKGLHPAPRFTGIPGQATYTTVEADTAISILKDRKTIGSAARTLAERGSFNGQTEPGWVTVIIDAPAEPTLWQRLTSWLGL